MALVVAAETAANSGDADSGSLFSLSSPVPQKCVPRAERRLTVTEGKALPTVGKLFPKYVLAIRESWSGHPDALYES